MMKDKAIQLYAGTVLPHPDRDFANLRTGVTLEVELQGDETLESQLPGLANRLAAAADTAMQVRLDWLEQEKQLAAAQHREQDRQARLADRRRRLQVVQEQAEREQEAIERLERGEPEDEIPF